MQEPLKILKRYWGHDSFRPLQEHVIEQVAQKKDVLALMPTGGGKSLCFQIPALMEPGICIVVSPLISLMEDQVTTLIEKGIKAMALPGGIPFSELDHLLDNCIYGNYKFLYLSPERLQQDLVQARIKKMNVNLIAIDEAHCISHWGHDFRPAYRNIRDLRALKPEVNVIGLTASATKLVVKDIVEQLQFQDPLVLKKSFERKNIAYSVLHAEDKNYRLVQLLKEHDEAAIIYVRSRKATVETSKFLEQKGFTATFYNGGLSKGEKSKRLKQWLSGKRQIMVATSAFGMGIDKANVRTVIHLNLPESLESYFQEAGRAGRDEQPAKAVVLTNQSDIPLLKNQFLSTLPDVPFVKLVYKKLMAYFSIAYGEGEGEAFNFNFGDFCQTYQLNYLKAYNSLRLLDRLSVFQLSERFQKRTTLQFISSPHHLTYFLEENPKYEPLAKAILRTYGGTFENKTEIDLALICSKVGTNQETALENLRQMDNLKLVEFEHDQHDASITMLVPREDESTLNPLIPVIKSQSNNKREKIEAVLEYVNNDKICRSEQLLRYFGETTIKQCGICSVCAPQNTQPLTREKMVEIYNAIRSLLKSDALSSRQITEKLPFEEQHILKVIRLLLEKGILNRTPTNTYKIVNT